ncbi:MAG TPA: FGGY family carbohydrate kinase [Rhodopila sp.]|nr:FGGY family carbohydrate kinase [Rhodopila sp.]
MPPVFCGVDLGSTKVKVLLLDGDGRVLWREACRTPRTQEGGGVATDAETLLATVETLMIAAFQGAQLSRPLVAVAVAGVGEDGVPVDARGIALDRAIPWFDRRAAALAEAMAARAPWHDAPLPVALDYSRTAAKWAWARRHRPAPLAAAKSWVALTDYPSARWSGQSFMSESLAARTACWHVGQRAWMEPLLADCGAPPLPRVVPGGTVLGPLHSPRLEAAEVVDGETSVIAGGHDHPVAAFAIRQLHPNAVIDSMGTAELIYAEIPESQGQPPPHRYFAFSRPVSGQGIACLGVTELSAALEPLMDDAGELGSAFRAIMAGAPVPGAPGAGPAVRDRLEEVTRGTAFRLAVLGELGAPPGPLFVGGGWARSNSFLNLRASMFDRDIHTFEEAELSAFGAAFLAARASGFSPPVLLAERTIPPNPAWARLYAQ